MYRGFGFIFLKPRCDSSHPGLGVRGVQVASLTCAHPLIHAEGVLGIHQAREDGVDHRLSSNHAATLVQSKTLLVNYSTVGNRRLCYKRPKTSRTSPSVGAGGGRSSPSACCDESSSDSS
jgi:hypothetical protein